MEIRAYNELYLPGAQNILGHAVDFAVMSLNMEPGILEKALSVSPSAKQFAAGNPRYVAGINGCEFARMLLDDAGISYPEVEDSMYLDRSPEFWAGWTLAYYQWFTDSSFMDIFHAASLDEILQMYPLYHEMDISQFTDRMNRKMKEAFPRTRLRERRGNCGLSQAQLSAEADVPLRQIQLFEQRRRDINRASAITLYKLSKALHCRMEELIEPEYF